MPEFLTPLQRIERRQRSRVRILEDQWDAVRALLKHTLPANLFYRQKLHAYASDPSDFNDWQRLPFTSKSELSSQAAEDGLAPHHTYPIKDYIRFHRTSGSTGKPLIVLDRQQDWDCWLSCWQDVLDAADVQTADVIFSAFSFGPFVGFWSAHEACLARGCRSVPGGGLSTLARLDLIQSSHSTVLFSTPSYAQHIASEARKNNIDPRKLGIRKIIVAGEPGGSVLSIRQQIESDFDAVLTDHAGATEVGPWGYGSRDGKSLIINEDYFLAEFLPIANDEIESNNRSQSKTLNPGIDPSPAIGIKFELVLTSLRRYGVPVIRYRTGDIVSPCWNSPIDGSDYVRLIGGVLDRTDQMLTIRGVNVFPSAVDAIIRSVPEVTEYRMVADRADTSDQLTIEAEVDSPCADRIVELFRVRLGLRVSVIELPSGSLARSPEKAKRFIDRRNTST